MTKPVFLEPLLKVTVVPTLMQNALLDLASGKCPVGATVELHFLVQDGEIRANATVRYIKTGSGLGLQFETVRSEDQTRFGKMVKRLMQVESPADPATKVLA